eukprot:3804404-Prymnesium_polylepis.1
MRLIVPRVHLSLICNWNCKHGNGSTQAAVAAAVVVAAVAAAAVVVAAAALPHAHGHRGHLDRPCPMS